MVPPAEMSLDRMTLDRMTLNRMALSGMTFDCAVIDGMNLALSENRSEIRTKSDK